MVNLYAHITYGVLTRECVILHTLNLGHVALCALTSREVHLAIGEASQHCHTCLNCSLLLLEDEVVVGSQRCRVECRHEDSLGLCLWVSDNAIRTLHNASPKTRLKQHLNNFRTLCLGDVSQLKRLSHLLLVGLYGNIKKLALLATVDGRNHTANGRGEQDTGIVLIKEQSLTCLNLVANLNQQLGRYALVIQWAHSIRLSHRSYLQDCLCLTLQIDVETFTQFNVFRHKNCS